MPAGRIQLDGVGGEAAVGNHLLAEGTDGTNTGKMFAQAAIQEGSFWQAWQTNAGTWETRGRAEESPRADSMQKPGGLGASELPQSAKS